VGMPDHVDGGPLILLQPSGSREGGPIQGNYKEKRGQNPPDMFFS